MPGGHKKHMIFSYIIHLQSLKHKFEAKKIQASHPSKTLKVIVSSSHFNNQMSTEREADNVTNNLQLRSNFTFQNKLPISDELNYL